MKEHQGWDPFGHPAAGSLSPSSRRQNAADWAGLLKGLVWLANSAHTITPTRRHAYCRKRIPTYTCFTINHPGVFPSISGFDTSGQDDKCEAGLRAICIARHGIGDHLVLRAIAAKEWE